MSESSPQNDYSIGDAVLADFGGAQIPGAIQDVRGGQFLVSLSQPWVDESGEQSSTVWLAADRLSPLAEGGAGGHALPG